MNNETIQLFVETIYNIYKEKESSPLPLAWGGNCTEWKPEFEQIIKNYDVRKIYWAIAAGLYEISINATEAVEALQENKRAVSNNISYNVPEDEFKRDFDRCIVGTFEWWLGTVIINICIIMSYLNIKYTPEGKVNKGTTLGYLDYIKKAAIEERLSTTKHLKFNKLTYSNMLQVCFTIVDNENIDLSWTGFVKK